jgi:hypothetical protein
MLTIIVMSEFLTVVSNLASMPSVLYFYYNKKNNLGLQVALTSFFSLIHHLLQERLVNFQDNDIFVKLDLFYSYWLIYVMEMYLFVPKYIHNINNLKNVLFPVFFILSLLPVNSLFIIPIVIFIGLFNLLFISSPKQKINIANHYFILLFILGGINIFVFWQATQSSYNYFHSLHHLICFNLPIIIDRYVVTEEKKENVIITI